MAVDLRKVLGEINDMLEQAKIEQAAKAEAALTRAVAEVTRAEADKAKVKESPCLEPAAGFLQEAVTQMQNRAAVRDTPQGERTAAQIAKVFNAITGHTISEADAWTLLIVLKVVRARNGAYNRDDYVDAAAYMSLLGECESLTRERKT